MFLYALLPKVLGSNLKLLLQLEVALLRSFVIEFALALECAGLVDLSAPVDLGQRLFLEFAVDLDFEGQALLQVGFLFGQKQVVGL